jgi:O-antigen/teichoic acid export membrane protein
VFVVSLPFAIGTIVFAKPILELFGLEFGAGVSALRILSLGQLIGVATGLAGTILIMIGEAGQAMWAVAVGTAVNLLACAALIPTFGVEGAAVATTASISATNILMMYLLWRRRGIYSAVLPFRRAPS